ncbi:sigma-54-dependent transcriptional regulator [Adhaeretor mobilis]|uniref:Transcriptional regulatory protein ZraR n=1 Tax=Adhaeretor mobilis TaxID=1930276 RepID=A0A517MXH3_9BACT|nr:sigma-54 dependent transcriptional regulator [Adhaeretor mobilis]QDS99559.1 Transcriptional regulatory protein ZraR [Adhaeretor mobilis]
MAKVPHAKILIADDEPLYLRTTGDLLRKAGYECICVADAHAAVEALSRESFDLVLSDLNMPGNAKLELLHQGREQWPNIPLIVITGVPSLPTAIESVRLGIADYLLKPVKYDDLLSSVRRALARPASNQPAAERNDDERRALAARFPEIIGDSPPMLELFDVIDRVAKTDANILITGESGTGKEVTARAIHRHSSRTEHKFQVIDCTAVPETLFESVLFGHVKGSFTGAVSDQDGLLRECNHGTAFFDEIGELPFPLQAKLLRVIQEQTFTPVGKNTFVQVDTRFLCATNRNLEMEMNAGRFRRDLFYRLGVIHLELPPLRDRSGDVVLLAQRFLQALRPRDSQVQGFSDEVLSRFQEYDWPGNIRELRNVVERAVALEPTEWIQISALPPALNPSRKIDSVSSNSFDNKSRVQAMDQAEHDYLTALLEQHEGNVSQAAEQAGMSRQGMHKLLKKHEISASQFRD